MWPNTMKMHHVKDESIEKSVNGYNLTWKNKKEKMDDSI